MSVHNQSPTTLEILTAITGGQFEGHWGLWGKKVNKTHFFRANQLEEYGAKAKSLSANDDVYLCMSAQEEDVGPNKRGGKDTVSTVFAFAADIDIGGEKDSGKNYPPDRETALAILDKFSVPYTYLQDSGRGFHVMWALEKPVRCKSSDDRKRTQRASNVFQKSLIEHYKAAGYDIDSVGDITRLLRVPNTLNHNVEPSTPVRPIKFQPKIKLSPSFIDELVEETKPNKTNKPNREFAPANHRAIQSECEWYARHTGDGAASSPEPDWYAALGITGHCDQGETIAHEYSAKHPEYDVDNTAKKLSRAIAEAGPRTCKAIEQELGSDFCKKCPHFARITSPIELGQVYRPGREGPIPVGYLKNGDFVLRDQVRKIMVTMSANQLLSHVCLMGMAPSEFWARQYPNKKSFNSTAAGEDLIKACKSAGPFDPTKVRGVGVWREGDRIIENLGDPVPHDTKELYLCFQPLHITKTNRDALDVDAINDFIGLFPWKYPKDAAFYLGWLMIAPISGALPWRPHIFVYGPANCGRLLYITTLELR